MTWIIAGDFNVILLSNEKRGGAICGYGCRYFHEFLHRHNLIDLGFKGPHFRTGGFPIYGSFSKLSEVDARGLDALVTNEDVKAALFDINPLKAPEKDGLHTLFFQSQWSTVGQLVCNWIKGIFDGKPINTEVNKMLLVLIPKVDGP
ncbi:hypothetical protein F3Y22_tig00112231pilonHSYRG00220 [Hibiscus syriacus]|uniref:Uncharacterized protein n=1 Tax=Hibiscus syriacus TaxID=106335 RepID=A0A6A2X3H7_HIBSY|nr:hypothetical protein F3Y22_tig00112231pilonHSYRG00220 [Hibiscus syriacus]